MNDYYYAKTNAGRLVAVTAADNPKVAVVFHESDEFQIPTLIHACNQDYSNVDGMTEERMRAEYGNGRTAFVVDGFDPEDSDCDCITYRVNRTHPHSVYEDINDYIDTIWEYIQGCSEDEIREIVIRDAEQTDDMDVREYLLYLLDEIVKVAVRALEQ